MLTASLSRAAGGMLEPVREIARRVHASDGFSVAALGLKDAASDQDQPGWQPVPVSHERVLGPHRLGYAPGFSRAIERLQPDLIHAHGLWMYPALASWRWRRRHGRPLIVSPHGMLEPWALSSSGWKKQLAALLFERRRLREASLLHALNRQEIGHMRAFGLDTAICCIPNGVSLPEQPTPLPEHGPRRLLYLGRLHPKKNLLALIQGWASARERSPAVQDWRLIIAGWGDPQYERQLHQAVGELGLSASVELPGPLHGSAKVQALATSSACVLASHSEGQPMSVLEAWAYARPMLMSQACNLDEGFDAGAALAVGTSPEEIADGLAAVAEMSPTERATMGAAGRALIERGFTWERVAAEMTSVYRWLLGDGPRPDCVLSSRDGRA